MNDSNGGWLCSNMDKGNPQTTSLTFVMLLGIFHCVAIAMPIYLFFTNHVRIIILTRLQLLYISYQEKISYFNINSSYHGMSLEYKAVVSCWLLQDNLINLPELFELGKLFYRRFGNPWNML